MAGAHLSLAIDDREFRRFGDHVIDLIQHPDLMFMDMGEALLISHRDRLTRGVSPDGQPFQPLSPIYRSEKPKNKDKVLIRDRYLFNSMGYQADSDALQLGTPLIYGATHQFGDADRGIHQREYIGLSSEDGRELQDIAADYLKGP